MTTYSVDHKGEDFLQLLDLQIKPLPVPETGKPVAMLSLVIKPAFSDGQPVAMAIVLLPEDVENTIAKLEIAKQEILNMGG